MVGKSKNGFVLLSLW